MKFEGKFYRVECKIQLYPCECGELRWLTAAFRIIDCPTAAPSAALSLLLSVSLNVHGHQRDTLICSFHSKSPLKSISLLLIRVIVVASVHGATEMEQIRDFRGSERCRITTKIKLLVFYLSGCWFYFLPVDLTLLHLQSKSSNQWTCQMFWLWNRNQILELQTWTCWWEEWGAVFNVGRILITFLTCVSLECYGDVWRVNTHV